MSTKAKERREEGKGEKGVRKGENKVDGVQPWHLHQLEVLKKVV